MALGLRVSDLVRQSAQNPSTMLLVEILGKSCLPKPQDPSALNPKTLQP